MTSLIEKLQATLLEKEVASAIQEEQVQGNVSIPDSDVSKYATIRLRQARRAIAIVRQHEAEQSAAPNDILAGVEAITNALEQWWFEATGQFAKKDCGHNFTCTCIPDRVRGALATAPALLEQVRAMGEKPDEHGHTLPLRCAIYLLQDRLRKTQSTLNLYGGVKRGSKAHGKLMEKNRKALVKSIELTAEYFATQPQPPEPKP